MNRSTKLVWASIVMVMCLAAIAKLLGCSVDYSALVAHKEACAKSGNVLIEKSKAEGEACWVTELRLGKLVKTDPDCMAYWGDAGIDLCTIVPGQDAHTIGLTFKDGGADAGH